MLSDFSISLWDYYDIIHHNESVSEMYIHMEWQEFPYFFKFDIQFYQFLIKKAKVVNSMQIPCETAPKWFTKKGENKVL